MRTTIKLPLPWLSLAVESEVVVPAETYRTTDYAAVWDCACGTTHAWTDSGQLVAATHHSENYWCDSCRDAHTETWWECVACGARLDPPTKTCYSDPVIEHFVTVERIRPFDSYTVTERWRRIRVYKFPPLTTPDEITTWLESLVADRDPDVTFR